MGEEEVDSTAARRAAALADGKRRRAERAQRVTAAAQADIAGDELQELLQARLRREREADAMRTRVEEEMRATMDIGVRVHPTLAAWSEAEAARKRRKA